MDRTAPNRLYPIAMERHELVKILTENIQSEMIRKELNAAEIARRANLNPTAVYDIVKGKSRSPRIDTLAKIADAMNIPIIYLLERRADTDTRANLLEAFSRLPEEERSRLLLTAQAWVDAKDKSPSQS